MGLEDPALHKWATFSAACFAQLQVSREWGFRLIRKGDGIILTNNFIAANNQSFPVPPDVHQVLLIRSLVHSACETLNGSEKTI